MQLARCPRIAAPVYSRVWQDVIREGHCDHAVIILKKRERRASLLESAPSLIFNHACVHGSTNGIPISFKVFPMVPFVMPLYMVPMVKTVGSQYCRPSTVWAKLPSIESHMIQYGVLNFKCINFTNKNCFYQVDIRK